MEKWVGFFSISWGSSLKMLPQLIELPRFIVQGFNPDFIGIDITEKEKR